MAAQFTSRAAKEAIEARWAAKKVCVSAVWRERKNFIPWSRSRTKVRSWPGLLSQYEGDSLISFVSGREKSEFAVYDREALMADCRFCWRS